MESETSESDGEETGKVIVIDNGTDSIKAGYAGQRAPQVIVPSVIGIPKQKDTDKDGEPRVHYVGKDALATKENLNLRYVLDNGVVSCWDDMEKLWKHVLHEEMKVDTEEHPVVLTEFPITPKIHREKAMELMLEHFRVSAYYSNLRAVFGLCSREEDTGLVFDLGDDLELGHVVPVYQGRHLPHGTMRWPLTNAYIRSKVVESIKQQGIQLNIMSDKDTIKDLMKSQCYVATNIGQSKQSIDDTVYVLPDGETVYLGEDRWRIPEIIFHPTELELPGVHEMVHWSIEKCDSSIRANLYKNIVITGGLSILTGLQERLLHELASLVPSSTELKVDTCTDKLSTWKGASMLAATEKFLQMCVTKEEYEEYGPTIVHRKCF